VSIFNTEPTRREGDRSAKLTWKLGEITDYDGEEATALAQLFVTHDKDRRQFLAVVQRIDVTDGGRVEKFQPFSGTRVRLGGVPCARYSAKGLDAAVQSALAELRSRVDEPEVQALANPSSPA
jgi:hypothetical protein